MNGIKKIIITIMGYLYYPFFKLRKYNILSIDKTIDYIEKSGCSIIRFGDGEFSLINGKDIMNYQSYSRELQLKLTQSLLFSNGNVLVCLPDTLVNMKKCNPKSKKIWKSEFFRNRKSYNKYISNNRIYGNAFVSRPYMTYKDKSKSKYLFDRLLSIFSDKNIVIIEGEYSRTGVGNDMFKKSLSIERIICPASNAFDKYNEILSTAKQISKDRLILVSLGPTSKPLVMDLVLEGYWALDIGHIDSEYEWFLSESTKKTKIVNKHTAEMDDENISECNDEAYKESIIKIIERGI